MYFYFTCKIIIVILLLCNWGIDVRTIIFSWWNKIITKNLLREIFLYPFRKLMEKGISVIAQSTWFLFYGTQKGFEKSFKRILRPWCFGIRREAKWWILQLAHLRSLEEVLHFVFHGAAISNDNIMFRKNQI